MAGLKYSKDGQTWTALKNYTIKNVDVLGTTGESTTAVMSQKAVTDALAAKADTSALSEYVKETELTEKVTEVVKTETSTGEVKSAIDAAVAGKADKTELDGLFGYVTYDNGEKKILFKHSETGATIGEVDASDFIKDGMVESVELTGGKLIVTWNAASGKQQATEIEVSKIFNADNYYDKEAADDKFATKAELEDYATTGAVTTGLAAKVDASTYNTDKANFATKDEVNAKATKATTIAGYGITDAKIANGVITLGSNIITPITSLDGVLKGSVRVVNVTSNLTNQTTSVPEGEQETVIFANNGTEHTVAISSEYKTPNNEQINLTIPADGYGEVNFLNVDGTIYVRGL